MVATTKLRTNLQCPLWVADLGACWASHKHSHQRSRRVKCRLWEVIIRDSQGGQIRMSLEGLLQRKKTPREGRLLEVYRECSQEVYRGSSQEECRGSSLEACNVCSLEECRGFSQVESSECSLVVVSHECNLVVV